MKKLCKICKSENIRYIHYGNTTLIKCANCEIIYNKDTSQDKEKSYYENQYSLRKNTIPLQSEIRRVSRQPEQFKLISEIMRFKKSPANIADIGCDRGYFLDETRRFGYSVFGVELSKEARTYTDLLKLDVFDSINDFPERMDVITMWHSLEHFSEPLVFLNELNIKMNSDSYIFIRVPDFGCFYSKVLKHRWKWFQPHNHYFHYTKSSLSKLLANAGFKVIHCNSQNPSDRLTDTAFKVAKDSIKKYFGQETSLRYTLGTIYEKWTCRELYLIAKKE